MVRVILVQPDTEKTLGLATGLPARIVSSAFAERPSTQSLWKVPVKLSVGAFDPEW